MPFCLANVNEILFPFFVIILAKCSTAILPLSVHAVTQQHLLYQLPCLGQGMTSQWAEKLRGGCWAGGQLRKPWSPERDEAAAALGQSEGCCWMLGPRGRREENGLCPCWFHFCWYRAQWGRTTEKKYCILLLRIVPGAVKAEVNWLRPGGGHCKGKDAALNPGVMLCM